MEADLHLNESARLAALESYGVLDTPAENAFDRLTRTAAYVMNVPIALVSFVARDRQFVKSCFGASISETPRDVAFCAHAILCDRPMVVLDALADPRFADNPLVTGPPYIRSYIGAPLIGSCGLPLGALCAIDLVPHNPPSDEQLSILADLAAEVVEQLEFRNARQALDRSLHELAQVQRSMLRATPASGALQVDLRFYPKHMAGGDFLCHYQVSENEELVLLTDVSGHDLKAAYLAAHSQGMVRAMLDRGVPVNEIFDELNNYLIGQSDTTGDVESSLAACALMYCSKSRELVVRNYGSPSPVYIDAKGFPNALDDARGSALGWFPGLEDAITVRVFDSGFLLAWTDGLEDLAFELGVTPLNMALCLHRGAADAPRPAWLLGARDDVMSVLIVLTSSPPCPQQQAWLPFVFQRWGAESAKEIDAIQLGWSRDLQFALPDLHESVTFDILLCTREAALNAMLYGCADGGEMTICMRLNRQEGLIRVNVYDDGPGHSFDASTRESLDLPAGHRGLLLIQQLSKNCIRERNGASLTMEFDYQTTDGKSRAL